MVLVNARDAKHVPGRKTDVSDAQWLRGLHEYGLLRASFRPKGELAALRAYLRYNARGSLLDYSASHIQHDAEGADADERPTPLLRGDRYDGRNWDADSSAPWLRVNETLAVLATHRDRRCHAAPEAEIAAALAGNWREEHVFALGQALELYDAYHAKVVECDLRIEAVLRRLREAAAKPAGRLPPARFIETKRPMRRPSMRGPHCMRSSASTPRKFMAWVLR